MEKGKTPPLSDIRVQMNLIGQNCKFLPSQLLSDFFTFGVAEGSTFDKILSCDLGQILKSIGN